MFDLSDLIGKYKINISCGHKELYNYIKDFPQIVYKRKMKCFFLFDGTPIKNFAFKFKVQIKSKWFICIARIRINNGCYLGALIYIRHMKFTHTVTQQKHSKEVGRK